MNFSGKKIFPKFAAPAKLRAAQSWNCSLRKLSALKKKIAIPSQSSKNKF